MSMSDYDPSRDQNSLGGPPPVFPSTGAGLDGGGGFGGAGGGNVSTGGPMESAGTVALSGAAPAAPAPSSAVPVISRPDTPAAPAATPASPAGGIGSVPAPTLGEGGVSSKGGGFGISPQDPSASPTDFSGVRAKVGLDGGATANGPGQFFADGGEVQDDSGADPQGAMGNDPLTQMISAAMDSVDRAFAFGRQKNGIMGGAQEQQKPQGQDDTSAQSQGADGDQDDVPGANASANDGDQDYEA